MVYRGGGAQYETSTLGAAQITPLSRDGTYSPDSPCKRRRVAVWLMESSKDISSSVGTGRFVTPSSRPRVHNLRASPPTRRRTSVSWGWRFPCGRCEHWRFCFFLPFSMTTTTKTANIFSRNALVRGAGCEGPCVLLPASHSTR